MSLVSINDVLKITTKVEKIHPYKVVGDRESYSPYNEGWSDCVSLIEHYLENLPSTEPERKKGEWIGDCCSCCGVSKYNYIKMVDDECGPFGTWNFCPNCGAEMARGGR